MHGDRQAAITGESLAYLKPKHGGTDITTQSRLCTTTSTTTRLRMSQEKKLILVIGATGAQGIAVIDALLAPAEDGTPSPYAVRALTRNPESGRAKSLSAKGVQCVKGGFHLLELGVIS